MKHLESSDDWLAIEALGSHGRQIKSSNRLWTLAYGQVWDPGVHSHSSDDPTGVVILFKEGRESARVEQLTRPDTVAISDAGVFAVYEWGKSTDRVCSRCQLQVFASDGHRIFLYRPAAVLELPTLSLSGRYLVFYTLGSPQGSPRPDEGESLFLVDLRAASVLWQLPIPIVWPTSITIDETREEVLVYGDGDDVAPFRYTLRGEFLDGDRVSQIRLVKLQADPYGYGLFELACSHLDEIRSGQLPGGQISQVEGFLNQALSKNMSDNTKARAHRLLGEIAEERKDYVTALQEYRAALSLSPRIGLRKKVKQLESQHPSVPD